VGGAEAAGELDHQAVSKAVRLSATLQRKDPRLPVYIDVPGAAIGAWKLQGTTTIEGSANGHEFGRRSIKYHSSPASDWFVEFTKPFLDKAGLAVGDTVAIELRLADMALPDEISARIKSDPAFASAYAALKPGHKRAALEFYLEAKTPAGRAKRLEKIGRSIKAPH
jgi:hypothetical protein